MRDRERERRNQRKRREQEIRLQMIVLAVGAALLLFLVIVGIEPWFKLDMQLGEGSGCTMSFAVMEAACAILERMATFEKAGIDDSYLEEIRESEKKVLE